MKKAGNDILAGIGELNEKLPRKRRNKANEINLKMRRHPWPELDEAKLWLREGQTWKGNTTLPRAMQLLINLINDISKRVTKEKSVPAGKALLVLRCRVFEAPMFNLGSGAMYVIHKCNLSCD